MDARHLVGLSLCVACGGDRIAAHDATVVADTAADAVADSADVSDVAPDTADVSDVAPDTAEPADTFTPDDTTEPADTADTTAPPTTLDAERDRLLDTLATVRGAADRCALWAGLDGIERGIFLTHTDMLGNRTCTADGCDAIARMAIAHVLRLWTINGSDPTCACTEGDDGYNCCNGGGEWHRIFFTADAALIAALRDGTLPGWRASSDIAGPHAPFTQSSETVVGEPRGQVHFFARDADAVVLHRQGVDGVLEPHVVELDNDYNILHDSNPEGCYGFAGLLCTYGRVKYRAAWRSYGNAAPTTLRGNGEPAPHDDLAGDAEYAPACPPPRAP